MPKLNETLKKMDINWLVSMTRQALRVKYNNKRADAKARGVGFYLTFEQWLKIWIDSDHLHEMGCHDGQYVMARHGDEGPYKVGNVRIATANENSIEKRMSIRGRIAISRANTGNHYSLGRVLSKETRLKIGRGNKGKLLGREKSAETKAKLAKAATGVVFSTERKEKIALRAIERWQNEEERQKSSRRTSAYFQENPEARQRAKEATIVAQARMREEGRRIGRPLKGSV